jgi:pilus assembly protein CpaF
MKLVNMIREVGNMSGRFSVAELIFNMNARRGTVETESGGHLDYGDILSKIQRIISERHSAELAQTLYSDAAETRLKTLIMRYLNSERLSAKGFSNISDLCGHIYDDMAGMGIISKYLKDPDVEEVNMNGCDDVWVQYRDRRERVPGFTNALDCTNIVRKMARFGGVILDGSKPIGDSYISKGVRMSGAIDPCVDSDRGAIASIRKQRPSFVTRENVIAWGTATEEELDFLSLCVNNGVSVAIAGATGAGKTADMGLLLSSVTSDKRTVIIEDTRELFLQGDDMDVTYMQTKEAPNEVSMLDLLKLSLRLHPEILVPAEMRGAEALTVQEAGRTGHTIVSTLHANSARAAYDRILTMCLQAGTKLSEERLLKNIVEAFPVMVFKRRLPDGTRKYVEIFEATGVEDGILLGNALFKFKVSRHERDESGRIVKTHALKHMGGIAVLEQFLKSWRNNCHSAAWMTPHLNRCGR